MWQSRRLLAVAGIIAVYLLLAFSRALTTEPWNDEAWYTAPSLNLVLHGNTGTPYLETVHKFWQGINLRTYWVVPLQFFAQVPWILLLGFSLPIMRSFAITWGLIALASWAYSVTKLTRDRTAGLLAMLLIGCDYQFVSQVALARMDAMALGLSSLGIAVYLALRDERLPQAIFFGALCAVASGLTHPTAGVPALTGLLFLIAALDFKRLKPVHSVPFLIPFVLGIAFWGWYISYAPELFKAQFFGNVTDIDRLGGFRHPLQAIEREFERYEGMAGFAPGMDQRYRYKLVIIAIYAICALGVALSKDLRAKRGVLTLLGLFLTFFVTMTFYENTKEVKYAIHIVALYDVLVAVFCVHLLRSGVLLQNLGRFLLALLIVVNISGLLLASRKNDYHVQYLPTIAFLQKSTSQTDLILGGSELGFGMGFNRNIVDDNEFTFYSRKLPTYIVIGPGYRDILNSSLARSPEIIEYFQDLLSQHYDLAFHTRGFEVYRRRPI